jgi:hypothetical protein
MNKPPKFQFLVSVATEESTGEVLAAYFQIRKGKYDHVKTFADGAAIADYDKNGYLLGVELLAPCRVQVIDQVAQTESFSTRSHVKQFLRKSGPRELVTAK